MDFSKGGFDSLLQFGELGIDHEDSVFSGANADIPPGPFEHIDGLGNRVGFNLNLIEFTGKGYANGKASSQKIGKERDPGD